MGDQSPMRQTPLLSRGKARRQLFEDDDSGIEVTPAVDSATSEHNSKNVEEQNNENSQLHSFWFIIRGNFDPDSAISQNYFELKVNEFEYVEEFPQVFRGYVKFRRSTKMTAARRFFGENLQINLKPRKQEEGTKQYKKFELPNSYLRHGSKVYQESPKRENKLERLINDAIRDVNTLTKGDAMRYIEKKSLKDYIMYRERIEKYFNEKFKTPCAPKYAIETFSRKPVDLNILKRKTVILIGPSTTGKTKYAEAQFNRPYTLTSLDMLRHVDPDMHTHVVIDEADFSTCSAEECLSLCDLEGTGQVRLRYVVGEIPAGMPRFITSNKAVDRIFPWEKFTTDQWTALLNRIVVFPIQNKLFTAKPARTAEIEVSYPLYKIPNTSIIVEVDEHTNYNELHKKFSNVLTSSSSASTTIVPQKRRWNQKRGQN